ncbi:MAG: hypothetical protein AAFQ16_11890, partial [Pseudomonadota bacterium]
MTTPSDSSEHIEPEEFSENTQLTKQDKSEKPAEVDLDAEEYAPLADDPQTRKRQMTEEERLEKARREMAAFEEGSLADALGRFIRQPNETWQMLQTIASTPVQRSERGDVLAAERTVDGVSLRPPATAPPVREIVPPTETTTSPAQDVQATWEPEPEPEPKIEQPLSTSERQKEALVLGLRITTVLIAWSGNSMVAAAGLNGRPDRVASGVAFLVAAVLAWAATEFFANWPALERWWDDIRTRFQRDDEPTLEKHKNESNTDDTRAVSEPLLTGIHPIRVVLFIFGIGALLLTITFNRDNQFTIIGFFAWMVSIVAFAGSLATDRFLFSNQSFMPRIPAFWRNPTFYALLAIVIVGFAFRTAALERTPPQMTSDHVEKLLDAQRVLDGNPQIFFPNNGGREPFQMYAMAVLSSIPGLNMNFTTLKLLSALEGVITLPFIWWLGREVIGRENRRMGNIVGLVMAGLVAVSGWHVAVSRLALRIILTPLMA